MEKPKQEDIHTLLFLEEDFIAIRRFNYSLEKLLERYPDGAPDRIIGQALAIDEGSVEQLYNETVERLRKLMGVSV